MLTSQGFWINARAFREDRLWGYGYFSCVDINLFVIQTSVVRKLMAI